MTSSGAVLQPSLTRRLRKAAVGALARTPLAHLFRPLTRGTGVVFMLHRFTARDSGVDGFDPGTLRAMLAFLRREGYDLVHVGAVMQGLRGNGPPLRRAVAFTIDDGYAEQALVAGPAFGEFDCPVTTFVTSGFLDRVLWFWWDQIEYVVGNTRRGELEIELGDGRRRYRLLGSSDRAAAQRDFTALCKALPDPVMRDAIRRFAVAADVELPAQAPPRYAPMTWDELRGAERGGMTFGPHTVTHPILARTDDAQCGREIRESWTRLRAEAREPVAVFAYPNGQPSDFGAREIECMKTIGLEGACTGVQAYATARRFHESDGAFRVPRFAFPDDLTYLCQLVTGLERFKLLVRGLD